MAISDKYAEIGALLKRMTPQQRRQFAEARKGEADASIILPMALSITQDEQELSQALDAEQKARQGEPPKIFDQALAQIAPQQQQLPENQGIATLPTQDAMSQNMAFGGITGYADDAPPQDIYSGDPEYGGPGMAGGGMVERYQTGGSTMGGLSRFLQLTGQTQAYVYGTAAEKAALEAAFQAATQGPASAAGAAAPTTTSAGQTAARAVLPRVGLMPAAGVAAIPIGMASGLTSAMNTMREAGYPVDQMGEFATEATPEQVAFDQARIGKAQAPAEKSPALSMAEERARNMALVNAEGSTRPVMANDPRLLGSFQAVSAPSAPRTPPAPATFGARPAAAPSGGLGDLDAMYARALKAAGEAPNPFAAQQKEVGEEKIAAAKEKTTGLEAIQKQYSDIYKGKKERLDTKEAELGKMKDQSTGLALLQAGAAMMSTPGGLGMALGKGVKVGAEQYAAGLDKLRSAQEKLADSRDRLEEIEAQRGELSARELFKSRSDEKAVAISAKEDLVKSNMQMYGVNRDTAMKMLDNQVRVGMGREEIAGRERAAARNPQLELLQAVKKDPALAQAYQSLHGTKGDLMAQYTDYIKSNPTASIEDFLKAKAVFSTLGAAGRAPVTNPPPGSVAPRSP